MTGLFARLRSGIRRLGFSLRYRLADLTYALGVATPKRTVAGTYWSYEPTNAHGDDPGLAALDALPDDAVILDVGAHVGEHAVPLARGTDRTVVALEPNGESADRLARTARRNGLGDRIDLRRAGAGDAAATLTFYRSTFSKCSAFDRDLATRWGARVAGTESVPVWRIDDLVEGISGADAEMDAARAAPAEPTAAAQAAPAGPTAPDPVRPPDAIKVDVEGHEAAVLRGAATTIETHRPLLVVEVHEAAPGAGVTGEADTLREWLTARNYAIEEAGDVWICRPRGK